MNDDSQYSISPDGPNKQIFHYLSEDCVFLNMPFILTIDKKLKVGMSYMKMEARHIDPVRLIKIWDGNNIVHLKIQDLNTKEICVISHNMEFPDNFGLWSIAEFDFLKCLSKKNSRIK